MTNIKFMMFELMLAMVLLEICFYGLLTTGSFCYLPGMVGASAAMLYIIYFLYSMACETKVNYHFYLIENSSPSDILTERIKGRM